ncbi:aldose 1-epimerase family protein [Calidifontibacter terrae]
MTTRTPSGDQWTLRAHDQELVVTQMGGGIRSYRVGGADALWGYPENKKADAGRGQLLMPWPNRIREGKYTFGGHSEQLSLTEAGRRNASHGLVRWALWNRVEQTDDSLTVAYSLLPQSGWDWMLDLTCTYRLTPDGLVVETAATNVGDEDAPFGYGAHPYLTAGEARVDELTLTLPAATMFEVDAQLIPIGRTPVPAPYDFREPRVIGEVEFDHAFTDLAAEGDRWAVTVRAGSRSTTLWAEAATFGYAQVFTGDSLPGGAARSTGVAVEPMSCPANAFVTGESLTVLTPGDTWRGSWGVTAGE